MPTTVAAVPTIETSSVMQNSGFESAVTIGGTAFIGDLEVNDALAVVQFNAQGSVAYPPNNALVVVDQTLSQLTAADAAMRAFTYTSPSVNIGAGLQTGYALLASPPAGSVPGVLLISSGQQTSGGTDPLTLSAYQPTWVCAPGPTANLTLLNQIAVLSNGTYNYAPTALYMQTILNQIRGQFPGWQTVVNQSKSVDPLGFWLQPVTLGTGLAEAQFSVVWENANYTQTNSSNPGPNQISVTLVQPPGIVLPTVPTLSGGGYCVFNMPTPVSGPGPWYVQVMYPGTADALPMTIGVFSRPTSQTSARLSLKPVAPPKAGKPVRINVALDGAIGPLEITSASAEIVAPRMSLNSIMRVHADALGGTKNDAAGQLQRLLALRRILLPKGDILGHQQRMVPLAIANTGRHSFTATEAAVEGGLHCRVHIQGHFGDIAAPFEKTELLSLYVPA